MTKEQVRAQLSQRIARKMEEAGRGPRTGETDDNMGMTSIQSPGTLDQVESPLQAQRRNTFSLRLACKMNQAGRSDKLHERTDKRVPDSSNLGVATGGGAPGTFDVIAPVPQSNKKKAPLSNEQQRDNLEQRISAKMEQTGCLVGPSSRSNRADASVKYMASEASSSATTVQDTFDEGLGLKMAEASSAGIHNDNIDSLRKDRKAPPNLKSEKENALLRSELQRDNLEQRITTKMEQTGRSIGPTSDSASAAESRASQQTKPGSSSVHFYPESIGRKIAEAETQMFNLERNRQSVGSGEADEEEFLARGAPNERCGEGNSATQSDRDLIGSRHNNRDSSFDVVVNEAMTGGQDDDLICAVLVDNEDVMEATLFDEKQWIRRKIVPRLCALLSIFVVVVVGLSVGLTTRDDDKSVVAETPAPTPVTPSPTFDLRPTLESIEDDGVLRCGVKLHPFYSRIDSESGREEGFAVDMCRAVAAAVLGNASYAIETVTVTTENRWRHLADHAVDLLISGDTHTMERDLYEPTTKRGYAFTVPYFYDGVRVGGIPEYVGCAEAFDRVTGHCSQIHVCAGATADDAYIDMILDQIPGYLITLVESSLQYADALANGTCNVVLGTLMEVAEDIIRDRGYTGDYKVGDLLLVKEPLAMVTREDEPQWSAFVNGILRGLMSAEAWNITQEKSGSFSNAPLFERNVIANAVAAVGNFGQIYERSFPRTAMNRLNDGTSGLIYSHPFGTFGSSIRANPGPNSTLHAIRERGQLRCGISPRDGFGEYNTKTEEWEGLDALYCKALAAAIFSGNTKKVEFIYVDLFEDRFAKLAAHDIDVLSGCSLNLRSADDGTGTNEILNGVGFLFSQPYFYYPDNTMVDLYHAMATRQDDTQFSDFVYWVVSATFYAAENNFNRAQFGSMPMVDFFGQDFNWMFKDLVRLLGNYHVMYDESGVHLSSNFTRHGSRNEINHNPPGPQNYALKFDGGGESSVPSSSPSVSFAPSST